ncbi:MAG TPA: glycosyl transferase [Desulfotomaculum sp.]|nr:glycosyl transferase [Desulfotomaculum sp.]
MLVASPVRQKPAILSEFLWSLAQLETAGLAVEYAFIDDHDEENPLLRQFAAGRDGVRIFPGGTLGDYHCDETTHYWREDLIWKVAAYKNRFIELARDEGFDYLFLVDSDLMLHPKTLIHLIGLEKDIVSEVYWTNWQPGIIPLPQVWLGDDYRLYHLKRGEELCKDEIQRRVKDFLRMLKCPGTYKVGGLGACTLISRRAISTGVSFSKIYNLGLAGEDRHFCIRAAVLGLELYADTHYPPYHIYRESELSGLRMYKKQHFPEVTADGPCAAAPAARYQKTKGSRITLAMLVRNEADRYLKRVLEQAVQYVNSAVILDDASDDDTALVCRRVLHSIPLTVTTNKEPSFGNEIILRKQLWELAVGTDPDWILILDADEEFEERAVWRLPALAADQEAEVYLFRLYDMWAEGYYREDTHWRAHHFYRPFMVRYIPGFDYQWHETPQHCGRFPKNITELRWVKSELRVKHLGWMRPADRLAKYYRYKELDPQGRYGVMEQYLSILDPKPNLVAWSDQEDAAD